MPTDDRTPEDWRTLMRTWTDDDPPRAATRRQRRHDRKSHRAAARRRSTDWLREERRRDPIRPGCALVLVVLVLAVGAGARYVVAPDDAAPARRVVPAVGAAGPQEDPAPPSSPEPSSIPSPAAVDTADPDAVAQAAIRQYLTRNPPQDHDHRASVHRAAPYLTPTLALNLSESSDPAYGRLVSRGGISTVRTVTVKPAGTSLPVDTPLRVWRRITATVDVHGYEDYSEVIVLDLELVFTGQGWRVSRMLGL